jgi:hypothetical protein
MRRLCLDPAVVQWRLLEDEVLAIDLANSRYLGINPSGALLWPLLAEGTTAPELVGALAQRWGLELERAGADVDSFIAWLDSEGLLLEERDV